MKNEVISIDVPNIGTINVSARMKGKCKTKLFDLLHYKYTLRIWSEHGEMNVTFHDSSENYPNVKKLGKNELIYALDAVLSDISMYLNDELEDCFDPIDECDLYKRAVRGCRNDTEKFSIVVGGDENIWKAIEVLTDYIIANN